MGPPPVRKMANGRRQLARRLCHLRNAQGLSQAAVAERMGIADTYLSRLERGLITPTLPLLERLARALNVKLHRLFLFDGVKSEANKPLELVPSGPQERSLLQAFREFSREDRLLLMYVAHRMIERADGAREDTHDGQAGRGRKRPAAGRGTKTSRTRRHHRLR